MTPSVGLDAERELTDGAVYYAREAKNADLGLAFVAEFERALELLCAYPRLGAPWRSGAASLCADFPTASFTTSLAKNCGLLRLPIIDASPVTGPVAGNSVSGGFNK